MNNSTEAEISLGIVSSFSVLLGIAFCVKRCKSACSNQEPQHSGDGFLLPIKSVSAIPVTFSLIGSFVTFYNTIWMPGEVFEHGISVLLRVFSSLIALPIALLFYLPIFRKIEVTSVFEYLELRFSKSVKILTSLLFIIERIMSLSNMAMYTIYAYDPYANSANLYASSVILVCGLYVTLTEFKDLIWIEAVQVIMSLLAVAAVAVFGTLHFDGLHVVWDAAVRGNRTYLSQPFEDGKSPPSVHTVWPTLIGMTSYYLYCYALDQSFVMRYQSLRTNLAADLSYIVAIAAKIVTFILAVIIGLLLYAAYEDIATQDLKVTNMYLTLNFLMDKLSGLRGLQYMYLIGIFSLTFSNFSSGLNSLATVSLNDIGLCCFATSRNTYRVSSILLTLIILTLCFIGQAVWRVRSVINGICFNFPGIILGLFTLGMFCPWSNSKGSLLGMAASLVLTIWIGIWRHIVMQWPTDLQTGAYRFYTALSLYHIAITAATVLLVGSVTSPLFRPDFVVTEDSELLSPLFKMKKRVVKKIKQRYHKSNEGGTMYSINTAYVGESPISDNFVNQNIEERAKSGPPRNLIYFLGSGTESSVWTGQHQQL